MGWFDKVRSFVGKSSPFTSRGQRFMKNMVPVAVGFATGGPAGAAAAGLNYLGEDAASDAYRDNRDASVAWEREQIARNYQTQKEFAQYGVRWRVEDARAAGIHPLAALGYQGPSYSASVGNPYSGGPDYSGANYINNMGQDISRAIMAKATASERAAAAAAQSTYDGLQLENMRLQNEGLSLENQLRTRKLANLAGPGLPPPMPVTEGSGAVSTVPFENTTRDPKNPAADAGTFSDYSWVETDGGFVRLPSNQAKQAMEDNLVNETMWMIRNQIAPIFGGTPPPDRYLKKGYEWYKSGLFSWGQRKKAVRSIPGFVPPGD